MSVETPAGQVLSFECEISRVPARSASPARSDGDRLDIETLGPGAATPQRTSIAWSSDFRGPLAAEQSLRRSRCSPASAAR